MQAVDHISADVSYPDPNNTSNDLYWRVWISSVNFLWTQHALPRSAIFTSTSHSTRAGSKGAIHALFNCLLSGGCKLRPIEKNKYEINIII